MDDNLREMGIGDQGVPRQMRRVGEAFYGRAQAYEAALAEQGDERWRRRSTRNVYAEAAEPQVAADARRLCAAGGGHDLDGAGARASVAAAA